MYNNSFNTVSNFQFGSYELKNLWWNVQSFTIPGIVMNPPRVNTRSGSNVILGADTVDYEDLNLSVIIDKELKVYDTLYHYFLEGLNVEKGTFEKFKMFDLWVQITDGDGKPIKKFNFYNCKLLNFGGMRYDSTTSDDNPNVLELSFGFDYMDYDGCFEKLHTPSECEIKYG